MELAAPIAMKGQVFVRSSYSLISSGTEISKVTTARKSFLGKAKEKPDQVRQVLDSIKQDGLKTTYLKVMNKLDAPSTLGYSLCGKVIEVGEGADGLKIGDMVACGGAEAAHAEVVTVPKNLVVRVPEKVKPEWGAFTTVGSIALQGIRRADTKLGESCAVIGLGLIGQLTVKMLNAAGVRVIGIDIDPLKVKVAEQNNPGLFLCRNENSIESLVSDYTDGYGADSVIITAGSKSLDPVELAGRICRNKGKVVIVGAVPTGFSRENYYKKELDLLMSTSYGPGRYDPNYEEKGLCYPYGYVRWTETRNMSAFLNMLAEGRINIDYLITKVFDFEKAVEAYDFILKSNDLVLGVLLKYNENADMSQTMHINYNNERQAKADSINIGFIGAGTFAQKYLLPPLKSLPVNLKGIAALDGITATHLGEKFGFEFATTNGQEISDSESIDTVFIATRHDSHYDLVKSCLLHNKNVYVEKPLTRKFEELKDLFKTFMQLTNKKKYTKTLMVGYNRRFAPHIQSIKQALHHDHPLVMEYRINAGPVPPEHWTQDKDIGGGRIIGEVCHFIDLLMFLANSRPVSVTASVLPDALNLQDNVQILLQFKNGSSGTITYIAKGNKKLAKERLEIHQAGNSYIVDDFKVLYEHGAKAKRHKLGSWDKGHKNEVVAFLDCLRNGKEPPIPPDELFYTSLTTFKVLESISHQCTIPIDIAELNEE